MNILIPDEKIIATIPFDEAIKDLNFIKLQVNFTPIDQVILPEYKGSTFRGCLGMALKRKVCRKNIRNCQDCTLRFTCSFALIFESPVAPLHPLYGKYSSSPHPYIIEPMLDKKEIFNCGELFGFNLILIGFASHYLPQIVDAFNIMGEIGIGRQRKQFNPVSLDTLDVTGEITQLDIFMHTPKITPDSIIVPNLKNTVKLELQTPLRIKDHGHLVNKSIPFPMLVNRITERLVLLSHFHCNTPLSESTDLSDASSEVSIASQQLEWLDWERFSGRQLTNMKFGGMIGNITYDGNVKPWARLLALGSLLHVGSTTTFGLGKYAII